MALELKMPALSPTMEKGTLARWLVGVGDVVGLPRDVERPDGTGEEEEQGRAERAPGPRWHQKVTLGACVASDEAWK